MPAKFGLAGPITDIMSVSISCFLTSQKLHFPLKTKAVSLDI